MDMHAERDYLVCDVFPQLREWCAARCIHLIDIDLRWGVTEEEALLNRNLVKICLNNIDRCRPFFLCLTGQRRGFIPDIPEKSEEMLEQFPCLKTHAGKKSITELEIIHALDRNKNPESLLFFEREPDYLEQLPDMALLHRIYTGNDEGKPDTFRVTLPQNTVKYSARWDRLLHTLEIAIPTSCNSHYPEITAGWRKKWKDVGIELPVDCVNLEGDVLEKAEILNKKLTQGRLTDFTSEGKSLGNVIFDAMCKAIIQENPDRVAPFDYNCQDAFVEQERSFYIVPQGVFDVLNRYVNSDENIPFLIVSPSGYGKTALLANWLPDEKSLQVVKGFVEADGHNDMASFVKKMIARMNVIPGKGNAFLTPLEALISSTPPETILVIDGWDILDSGLEPGWLQRKLSSGVKLIVSLCTDSPRAVEITNFLKKSGLAHIYELPCLSMEEKHNLIDEFLGRYLKRLDEALVDKLIHQSAANNPLYLRASLSLLRIHSSYESLGELISFGIGPTLVSVIRATLIRLCSIPQTSSISPRFMVSALFSLICSARHHMNISEIVEAVTFMPSIKLLNLADNPNLIQKEINRLLRLSESILRRVGNRYMRACDELVEVCKQMFDMNEAHRALAQVYSHQLDTPEIDEYIDRNNAVLDIVYHLFEFNSAGAMAMLLNPQYLERRVLLGFMGALRDDFNKATRYDAAFTELGDILLSHSYILQKHPDSLANILYFYGSSTVKQFVFNWFQNGLLPGGLMELKPIALPQPPSEISSVYTVEILYRSTGWSPLAYSCAPQRGIFIACLYMGELTVINDADSDKFSLFRSSMKFSIERKPVIKIVASSDGERIVVAFRDGTFACYRLGYDTKNVPVGCALMIQGEYKKHNGEQPAIGWAGHTLIWQHSGMLRAYNTDEDKYEDILPIDGELAFISGSHENIFLVIRGINSRYLVIGEGNTVNELETLYNPPLAAACDGNTYVVSMWNGEVHIYRNGKKFSCHMKQPIHSCAVLKSGVTCIDMHKTLYFIDWEGVVSNLGSVPEEAAGNNCLLFSNDHILLAISTNGRCRFTINPGKDDPISVRVISSGCRRALFVSNEEIWLVDQQTNKILHFYAHGSTEYVGNIFGELCSDKSFGFHNVLPNTLEGLSEHFLPTIKLNKHILFSAGRDAGGFYLFGEDSIYRLQIRSKSINNDMMSGDADECIRIGMLEPGTTPIHAAVSKQNILLLITRTFQIQNKLINNYSLLLLYETNQGNFEYITRIEEDYQKDMDFKESMLCSDGADGFFITIKTGFFHMSANGELKNLNARVPYPIQKMYHIPKIGLFFLKDTVLYSYMPETGRIASFTSANEVTDLAVWGNEPVIVLGNKYVYKIKWRMQ